MARPRLPSGCAVRARPALKRPGACPAGGKSITRTLACPDCAVGMDHVMVHGLLLEHCAQCRGVFFDRGELEAVARARLEPMGIRCTAAYEGLVLEL